MKLYEIPRFSPQNPIPENSIVRLPPPPFFFFFFRSDTSPLPSCFNNRFTTRRASLALTPRFRAQVPRERERNPRAVKHPGWCRRKKKEKKEFFCTNARASLAIEGNREIVKEPHLAQFRSRSTTRRNKACSERTSIHLLHPSPPPLIPFSKCDKTNNALPPCVSIASPSRDEACNAG